MKHVLVAGYALLLEISSNLEISSLVTLVMTPLEWIMSTILLTGVLALQDILSRWPQVVSGDWIGLCLLLLSLAVCYGWQKWHEIPVEILSPPSTPLTLEGDVTFDPIHGLMANISIDGQVKPVVIQPKYWQFLNSALKNGDMETVCLGGISSSVVPGSEPGSLVGITLESGIIVGFGARVRRTGGNKTILVTASHVLSRHKASTLYLTKFSPKDKVLKRIIIDPEWTTEFCSSSTSVDLIALNVPGQVWSRLGVKAAEVASPTSNAPVSVFGGKQLNALASSTGIVNYDSGLRVLHTCNTSKGWSGSPVYSQKGQIVAIHTNAGEVGVNNLATMLLPFTDDLETFYDDGILREVDPEEMEDVPHADVFVTGRGKLLLGAGVYAQDTFWHRGIKEGKKKWGDALDGDDDISEWIDEKFYDTQETIEVSGNGVQAASACSLPCEPLETIGGKLPTGLPPQACHSIPWEDRVCNLEKLAEQSALITSQLHSDISLLSLTLTGLREDLRRNSPHCSCKQEGSGKPKPQKTSTEPCQSSSKNTPAQTNADASPETLGKKRKSRRKSKKSASPKSNETPPQESHSKS